MSGRRHGTRHSHLLSRRPEGHVRELRALRELQRLLDEELDAAIGDVLAQLRDRDRESGGSS